VVSGSLLGRCVGSCVGSLEGWGCRRHGVGVCGGEGAAYRAEKGWGEDRASGEEFHITFFSVEAGIEERGVICRGYSAYSYIRWLRGLGVLTS